MQAHLAVAAHARRADRTVSPSCHRRCRAASGAAIALVVVLALGSAPAGAADARSASTSARALSASARAASAQPARPALPARPPAPSRGPGPRSAATPRVQTPSAPATLGTFVELRNDYITRGSRGFFNAAVIRGDYAVGGSFSLRADVPLAYAGGALGERDAGLGDILVRPLVRAVGTPRFALVLGSDLVLDSATSRALGAGKNQIAPLVQAFVRLSGAARVGLQLQHVASFGGDPRRDDIQASVVRPFAILALPRGFWVQPDQSFQINHLAAPRLVSTSVLEVGTEISERVQVYVDPGIQVGSDGAVDWLVTGAVRWAFPQRARARELAAARE
ncbi:hypothetical protein SOCE26_045040 [Sorangium cellulosum]|uniref:Uncharacterized protein n=1 Tax=Sorangium cellulosum TaxID=56 RepID=A0A2L0EUT8_SORCE|nr:hypothetical protein [Sorangium cellulosum]AUX43064.1 hypothetical protein SOCE26_045040 [Sorangium cellulosum]